MRKVLGSSLLCALLLSGFGLYQAFGLFTASGAAPRPETTAEAADLAARQQCQGPALHWRSMVMHGQ